MSEQKNEKKLNNDYEFQKFTTLNGLLESLPREAQRTILEMGSNEDESAYDFVQGGRVMLPDSALNYMYKIAYIDDSRLNSNQRNFLQQYLSLYLGATDQKHESVLAKLNDHIRVKSPDGISVTEAKRAIEYLEKEQKAYRSKHPVQTFFKSLVEDKTLQRIYERILTDPSYSDSDRYQVTVFMYINASDKKLATHLLTGKKQSALDNLLSEKVIAKTPISKAVTEPAPKPTTPKGARKS